jgi:hypothetical protein
MVAKINGKDGATIGNQAALAPPLRVGRIVCGDSSISPLSAPARVLWADHEDEESLPSPLHPIRALSFDGFQMILIPRRFLLVMVLCLLSRLPRQRFHRFSLPCLGTWVWLLDRHLLSWQRTLLFSLPRLRA